jgi:hypothetical protein
MTLRLANTARSAAADGIVDLLDAGAGAGKIEIRTGSQPATPDTAATGTVLSTVTLSDPAFGAASNGVVTLAGTPLEDTGDADGTAGWFRAYDSNNNAVMDGSCTATGGGGELELATLTISTGVTFRITGGTFTMPVG